jgi:hypothetical protein
MCKGHTNFRGLVALQTLPHSCAAHRPGSRARFMSLPNTARKIAHARRAAFDRGALGAMRPGPSMSD